MLTDLFFVVLGSAATLLSVFVCGLAFEAFRRQSYRLWQREQRLPEATKYEYLQQRIAELQDAFDRLRDAVFEAEQIISERDRAQQRLEEIQGELSQRDSEVAELQKTRNELDELRNEYANMFQTKQDLDEQIRSEQLRLGELQRQLRELSQQVELAEAAKSRAEELQKQVEILERQKAELERQAESLEQQAQRKLNDYNSQLRDLKSNRDELEDELKLEGKRLDDLRGHRQKEEKQLAGLRAEREELDHRLPLLRSDWEQMLTRVGHAADEQRTQELWAPMFLRADYQLVGAATEEEQLGELQDYLDQNGLRFHPRVLNAFHTALKVNDISPLVVLAGISGTGKSELPRRYAEAMGIHFLNIAVQPRWDSPQDMFGFFNYLEGRYRATELGRALVQMDPFHDEPDRGWDTPQGWREHSLSDQMLLVLLDEMNLARIEYYFSEFLSRLEMRRGVNTMNSVDRRKSEIPLEVGRGGKSGSLMHIFVGRNVLFTGTMNEDETTQSLSDKVVDRANVLRFGSPSNLVVPQSNENGNGQPLRTRRLAFDVWESWQRDAETTLDTATRERVHGWMHKLNEAMSNIRRPFAYRVSRAVESYVANYPRGDDRWLEWAMSDQIEQKMLPKLRGLDCSEQGVRTAIGLVDGVVNELADEPLRQAIQESKTEHQFLWQGVKRSSEEFVGS